MSTRRESDRPAAPDATVGRIVGLVKLGRQHSAPEPPVQVVDEIDGAAGKGRPTPKRRDVVGAKGPVTAPRTRKEAYARQKEQSKLAKTARKTPAAQLTVAQRRELMRQGDPSVLPRRDQGPAKKIARDYVDSHRMLSNYLWVLFVALVASFAVPVIQLVVLVGFVALVAEWMIVGRRVRSITIARHGESAGGKALSLGVYAGTRAYMLRRWRLPGPQVERGEQI